ncbi:MAG: right-handed parallel beta-helix repeat-containing protein [Phycisphaerae bacterium]|jgi:parallel beta-helix repeat protein
MSRGFVFLAALLLCRVNVVVGLSEEARPDKPGFRITADARVASGVYALADQTDEGAIRIIGDNITVDFQGATLSGAAPGTDPDGYIGRGVVIRGRNVTVRNLTVRGYKVGIYAEDSPELTLRGCDVSRNYRRRLESTIRHEDFSDWLFGHENDKNEWLRYGAGIYLYECPRATVVGCRARNGQNGLCISRSDHCRIADNDMSFMSGWGLAMWRSSRCEVMSNKFDWCIRGYSHGAYARGQDSAGILVYEQCNDNLFAHNSATHGGDGFFLYAGNETLKKTGAGGCNGNIVYKNDFSHAAANGIEATFSKDNVFIDNTLHECHHGVWAGYSYETEIRGNDIRDCTYGVSIEHGRHNVIGLNVIRDTKVGVQLWWDKDEKLLASPFCKSHGRCDARNTRVLQNRFQSVETAVRIDSAEHTVVRGNTMQAVEVPVHLDGVFEHVDLELNEKDRSRIVNDGLGTICTPGVDCPFVHHVFPDVLAKHPRLVTGAGKQHAFLPSGARRGREHIYVHEWGPYDFSDVRVFPSRVLAGPKAVFQLLGPGSTFQVADISGEVAVTPENGKLPQKLTVKAQKPGLHPFTVDIAASGETHHAGGVLLNTKWSVKFYAWSDTDDPREGTDAWQRILSKPPLDELSTNDLDFVWYARPPSDNVPPDRFATVAATTLDLPAGKYRLRTVSDDGIRVIVDGKEVLSNWTWHPAQRNAAVVDLDAGTHALRIEHFEIDGYAQLQFWMEPADR